MNEREYYVKLKYDVYIDEDEDKDEHSNYYDDSVWLGVDYDFVPKKYRGIFFIQELERVTQGTLTRYCAYDDLTEISLVGNIVDDYWINPMIELIPYEEVEYCE